MKSRIENIELVAQADNLLEKMNLRQKIGQMTQAERMSVTPEEVKYYHLGSVLSGGGSGPGGNLPLDWLAMCDDYWLASMQEDKNHIAIPLIYGVDAVHGHNNVRGATIFPHNIGLGAANDPALVQKIGEATAREIQATGVDWTFDPALSVARNDRWGRTYESYSEAPEIVTSYAAKAVLGLQTQGVVACAKHWLGDGGTLHGLDQGDTVLVEKELVDLHMAPYLPALDAGVLTVMASFNSWNGDKCHGHKYLITDKLKRELGFAGFVISDWDGADYLSENYNDAINMAVMAGIDMFMVPENWKIFIELLVAQVEQGTIPMERIDDAVRRILKVKLAVGLFDRPKPSLRLTTIQENCGSESHRNIAREAVRKSLVLLKNGDNCLPLDARKRVLVAGKNAHNRGNQCGGWSVSWQGSGGNDKIEGGESIWEGIQAMAPNAVLSADGSGIDADPELHDVAVIVIGELPYAEGMGDIRDGDHVLIEAGSSIKGLVKTLEPYGRTLELSELHPEDLRAIRNVTDKGIQAVVILISGRPLVVNKELAEASAFVAAWLPGSEGKGIAEVIFGDHDFQGKLAFSWPVNPSDNFNRGDVNYAPLFEYGFGLSYSS
ncbi:MAG: beta-glucosidase [Candidatus Azotimanducaceae bacterium]|jgi:beta-glucosidase